MLYLKALKGSLAAGGLVWDHAAHDAVEHAAWGLEVEWTTLRVSVVALAQVLLELELVAVHCLTTIC